MIADLELSQLQCNKQETAAAGATRTYRSSCCGSTTTLPPRIRRSPLCFRKIRPHPASSRIVCPGRRAGDTVGDQRDLALEPA
jgi:hypothetical protein